MINLIKKDLIVTYSNKVSIITILLYFPLILLILGTKDINSIFMFSTFSFVFIMIKIPFAYEIRDKPHIFIQSLPVKKSDIVISKYISMIINFIMATVYTLTYMWVSNALGIIDVDKIEISTILFTLGLTMLSLSLSMPMQFRFTPKVANYLNMLSFIIVINIIMLDGDTLIRILSLDLNDFYKRLLLIAGVLGVYLISIAVSISLYKNRKFY